jgi:excinuclease ABC subunit A
MSHHENQSAAVRRASPALVGVQTARTKELRAPESAAPTKSRAVPAIRLRGVRHNNLKNFDLDIPIGRLTVITGLSGSGKSSLAFDTLFAEGQRRYIETFSPYARQFFDRMDKPQVDRIEGIPPAIAIEQRNSVRSTRSTVGTMTELCDYMKLLWPHLARLHCQKCGQPVRREPPQVVWESVNAEFGTRNAECLITFTVPLYEKLSLKDSLDLIARQGYQRVLAGAEIVRIDEAAAHSAFRVPCSALTVVQDRLKLTSTNRARFIEACEQAYHFGKGRLVVRLVDSLNRSTVEPDHDPTIQPFNASTRLFSSGFHCAACDLDYREPSPALFSFNHPAGACPTCKGFGRIISIDYNLAIPDRSKTLSQGAVKPWQTETGAQCQVDLGKACRKRKVPMDVAFAGLSEEDQRWVIDGDSGYDSDDPDNSWPRKWYGVKGYFRWLESKSYKMHVRVLLSRYRAYTTCEACGGKRLKPEALLYRCPISDFRFPISDLERGEGERSNSSIIDHRSSISLADFYALPVECALELVEQLAGRNASRSNDPITLALNEVRARLHYLAEVGLGYLTLDRPTRTLSGGETERVNLTTCLGARLVNTLFVLDEPSVGLHPRDTARLVCILERLRDTGNTVVVVEHEASVMRAADQIVDLGPGQGEKGGELVFCGPLNELMSSDRSLTGQYLSGRKQIEVPERRAVNVGQASSLSRMTKSLSTSTTLALNDTAVPYGDRLEAHPALKVSNATRHNLRNLTVEIPLKRFVALTGVSGSGKTTLIREILLPALQARLGATGSAVIIKASDRMEADESDEQNSQVSIPNFQFSISGFESLGQVVLVDQSPLGKTPRSNPVVYIGAFDDVRELFAQTDLARQRGLNGSAFSFNSGVGQCERCRGAGFEKIEMQFLSDIFIRCPECNGRRYREHILDVKLRSGPRAWSIADALEATVDDALEFLMNFIQVPAGRRALVRLKLLQDVGLGYLRLGQPINTLSGGESQRLKLVSYLAEWAAGQLVESSVARLDTKNTRIEVKEWLAKRGARLSGGSFPLSPALSLREREELPPPVSGSDTGAVRLTQRVGSSPKRNASLPLPGGEGRGEGELISASAHSSSNTKGTLFLFDEPTTGLHFDDVRVLLRVFQRLVDAGHSIVVIEHNLDVIKCADWVIDLGPDAGDRGGQLVAAGTPEDIAACEASHTGRFLRELLKK